MLLSVKNMVCNRCIKVVKQVFDELQIPVDTITLGKVDTKNELSTEVLDELKSALEKEGFEVIEGQKAKTVERVKNLIVDLIYNKGLEDNQENISTYLSKHLHKEYTSLSQLFSSVENTTIEQFFILQKIERIKELLVYEDLTLSEIAYKMSYSSVAHLSAQFKKMTGFTPSQFKQLKDHHRKPIDGL
ncbi:helix-turn-helix domain-containing protein [Chitinophagaceae bacterium LWZ2-11]